jgi:hypothetical protein
MMHDASKIIMKPVYCRVGQALHQHGASLVNLPLGFGFDDLTLHFWSVLETSSILVLPR